MAVWPSLAIWSRRSPWPTRSSAAGCLPDAPKLRDKRWRSAARYGHAASATQKVAPEGVEALKELSAPVDRILAQLIGGIQSGMGYLGAANLAQLRERARFIRVSPAGMREASPHDIVEVKTGAQD